MFLKEMNIYYLWTVQFFLGCFEDRFILFSHCGGAGGGLVAG